MTEAITVGRFSYDPADRTISGPEDFLDSAEARAVLEHPERNEVVRFGLMKHPYDDPVVAVLIALQTEFGGWLGARQTQQAIAAAEEGR
jgi:hypothetical protein